MPSLLWSATVAAALSACFVAGASAHASLEEPEAAAGPYKAVLRIPHGCDGRSTHTVRLEIPEGYIGVKPMPKPGWTVRTEKGNYARGYTLHGEKVASGVISVTWSGGNLPDDFFDEFVVSGTIAAEPGATLHFVATQVCDQGQVAWNEIAAEGEDPHALEHPAPTLLVQAEAGGHDHGAAAGAEVTLGALTISSAWASAMLPGQPAGGGYLTVRNGGAEADRLLSIASPAAEKAEVHRMQVVDDVMVMRPVADGLEIPAGGLLELKPGGFHLMFSKVKEPFEAGTTVPVTLTFEKAGQVEIVLPVRPAGAGAHEH
jgi:periplasmic copper chaperone A